MKGFITRKRPEGRVEIEPKDITVDEFIVLAGASLDLALRSAYNQISSKQELTEEESKELRAALYDRLILITTEIANSIYPEHVDLYEKTPEAMLASLDKRVKELKELQEQNESSQSREA